MARWGLAKQHGTIILISGDGSFQMNLRELQTIVPDFAKLALAYGILGLKATTINEATDVIKQVFAHDGPVVMDFSVHE